VTPSHLGEAASQWNVVVACVNLFALQDRGVSSISLEAVSHWLDCILTMEPVVELEVLYLLRDSTTELKIVYSETIQQLMVDPEVPSGGEVERLLAQGDTTISLLVCVMAFSQTTMDHATIQSIVGHLHNVEDFALKIRTATENKDHAPHVMLIPTDVKFQGVPKHASAQKPCCKMPCKIRPVPPQWKFAQTLTFFSTNKFRHP